MEKKQLVDQHGTVIPPRVTLRDRWAALSRGARAVVLAVTVFVAGLAAFLGSLDKIWTFFAAPISQTTKDTPQTTGGQSSDTQSVREMLEAFADAQSRGSEADAEQLKQQLKQFLQLEKLLAIYSLVAWVSPQQQNPLVTRNDAFGGGETFNLDCADIGGDNDSVQMGHLFRCFATPVTKYIPRAGEEVETTYLVSSEDIWYQFKWHSIFGYEMDVLVNRGNDLVSLANKLGSQELDGEGPIPTYAVEISGYGHSGTSTSIGFVVRAGCVGKLDNGAISVDDNDVEIHFASGDKITGEELVKAIRLLLRELGVDKPTLASAGAAVQTELLKKTPRGIGELSSAVTKDSAVRKILDSL